MRDNVDVPNAAKLYRSEKVKMAAVRLCVFHHNKITLQVVSHDGIPHAALGTGTLGLHQCTLSAEHTTCTQ